ncbi:GGDEF domain-containing protein [Colwellia hornerae]|nr:GGDEF domain-containing protein [Colwellia hornerae]
MYQSNILVDHIANFTSHRDKELLAFSLLKSVNSMMDCSKVKIITTNKKGEFISAITFENSTCTVNNASVEVDDILKNAFKSMNASSIKEQLLKTPKGYLLILLLHHDRKGEQFLVVNLKEQADKVQSYILSGILSIYNNFFTLLNESQTDELTGLANRKTFDSAISKVFDSLPASFEDIDERRQLTDKPPHPTTRFWLAMVDIDHFKLVNDRFGHLYGDEILIHLAQIIRSSFRQEDLQFRFGGEEFIILLAAENDEDCAEILERFRQSVADYSFPSVDDITVSIGVAEFKRGTFHVTSIDYADQALYYSKENGRNKITFFEELLSRGEVKTAAIEEGEIDLF